MVQDVHVSYRNNKKVVLINILTRGALSRKDLIELKKKIELHFKGDLIIRTTVHYIL